MGQTLKLNSAEGAIRADIWSTAFRACSKSRSLISFHRAHRREVKAESFNKKLIQVMST